MNKHTLNYEKMPGHWLLASLGKTVLRPGGIQMTRQMLEHLAITERDFVVEFAPGLGITAKMTLEKNPSYIAVERDEEAAKKVNDYLNGENQRCIVGSAEQTGLPNTCATVVYGEAMLTMQSTKQKNAIISEAKRLLKPGGTYAIHEMCLTPSTIDSMQREHIRKDLVNAIKVNALPLTVEEWQAILRQHGFIIEHVETAPMHLLYPKRLVEDEGIFGVLKIIKNIVSNSKARKRVLFMRKTFMKHNQYLQGISIVARLPQ
ncbi:class I SAM-dependent methyltransferase [Lysinibacillus cavernae]|uniref:class I SAM-dependent methyltransferase n=1 Tax=Lysinibacillus cavernae TaxID=2666135 RepID=UPI0012D91949|nr:class I SAM-dependent methyltransferase [Lysinibacillus cavernae]